MDQVPDFWRTEVWHPLSVHFPIVLLSSSSLARIVDLFLSGGNKKIWKYMSRVFLYAGVVTAWASIYTGALADSEVTRSLCDPTVLESHENAAYTLAYLFSAAALLDLLTFFPISILKYSPLKETVIIVLLLTGSGYLVYVGHLGATLVYQQGAGVYKPSKDCHEFE